MVQKRRRRAAKIKRLNLYLEAETYDQIARIAELRGVGDGAGARALLEERIEQIVGRRQEAVPA
jgi:hypothetical protein